LQVFESYVKDTTSKLSRKVEDLEDVRFVMSVLKEVPPSPPPLHFPHICNVVFSKSVPTQQATNPLILGEAEILESRDT
jgi:hypothetical protein